MIQHVIRELKLIRPIFYLIPSVMVLIFVVLIDTSENMDVGASIYMFMISFACITSFSQIIREQPEVSFLAQSLPAFRKQLVGARFLVGVPVIMISFIIYTVIIGVMSLANFGVVASIPSWRAVAVACVFHFVASSFYHVIHYRFGSNISQFLTVFLLTFSFSFMFGLGAGGGLIEKWMLWLDNPLNVLGMLAVTGLITSFSYWLCIRLYEKHRS
ncbi:hypothetical protein CEW92_12815 [Bacillaceae bacterium SAS-127]|nr:hypothetical protein CEW92_12815 [Bacillaceae bacterium SAS-127]